MRFSSLLCLLLLLACTYTLAQGSFGDCCLGHVKGMKKNLKRNIVGYTMQKTDGDCNLPAVVFNMRRGKNICANPDQQWVQHLMAQVQKKNQIV